MSNMLLAARSLHDIKLLALLYSAQQKRTQELLKKLTATSPILCHFAVVTCWSFIFVSEQAMTPPAACGD